MTTEHDPRTRIVLSWLREDAHEDAERLLLRTLDEVDTTPQRGPWWPARRSLDMNSFAKLAIATAAVVLVAVAGFQLLPRNGTPGGQPVATPSLTTSPKTSAIPSPRPVGNGPLDPGEYAWSWSAPVVSFQVPEGWTGKSPDILKHSDQPTELGIAPWLPGGRTVTHVYTDACHSEGALEPLDGTLQGLVDALDAQASTDATVTDVTLGGRPAKRVDLATSAGVNIDNCRYGAGGPLQIWAPPTESTFYALFGGARGFVVALEIEGELVVFSGSISPEAPASDIAELEAIVESIRIGP